MSKELELATDLTGLLEDERFLAAFCGGCPYMPKLYFEECPVCFDPEARDCPRRRLYQSIKETLKGAEEDIVIDMRQAGCIA